MKENIKIITAGAGSGKTYRLADEVLQAIRQKKARPEGILLTTFTRKAAAELEERVRERLLEQGAWEEAQRIRQAWIGTIDSVCLRIIQEYAFEAGQSPEIAVFGTGEDLIEFNRALTDSVTDKELEQLDSLSQSLSIQDWYDRNRDWRSIVKDVADGARANRIDNDMGKSGFSMDHRSGWQRMLADITNNAVGIVFATSVSRLTRQSSTYEQLLSLAADHGTLLCIGKGIIDPSNGLWRNHK